MSLDTFYPPVAPSPGTSRKPELDILKASFGDGYGQSVPNGINHQRQVHNLRWDVLTEGQANAIESFLEAKGGYRAFLYLPHGASAPIAVTCEDWNREFQAAGLSAFTAVFRQSFNVVP